MGWTRREAIAGAGAALLALRAGPAAAMPADAPTPLRLARGFDLRPAGVRWPGAPEDYRVLREQPWAAPLIARSSLIRFWADWPVLQPTPVPLEDPANPGLANLAALDGQIDAARADGLDVIVMPYRYPLWVTGATAWRWGVAQQYQLPDSGHGPYSPWAVFVDALWRRYAGRMTHFEVVNEPNLQLMPQRDMPERVAVMITTADAIARRHGLAATCLAPSCSDADSLRMPPRMTRQPEFADRLLRALDAGGFAGGDHWIWSFHNYNESENGGNRSGRLREQLAGRWPGRLAPDGGPLLYATEGGVRLSFVARRRSGAAAVRAGQAE
ncbi:MAG TPA: hypothetical protein VD836_04455, partial [Solirubrobacteraceae bacterium]|nr:hypothetical protein [Solirubrobacteraceae bacterium]